MFEVQGKPLIHKRIVVMVAVRWRIFVEQTYYLI